MRVALVAALVMVIWFPAVGTGQEPPTPQETPRPTFRSSVQRVLIAASVRTRRGRPVTGLEAKDFTLRDSGVVKRILEFHSDPAPISVGLLVDFSGSMGVAARRAAAYETAQFLMSELKTGADRAGLYVFDKYLREAHPLAPAPGDVLARLRDVQSPFGVTSLFDAIAETGNIVARDGGPRRAVVALTDGSDNASRMTPEAVSALASVIDVPVYVILVVSPYHVGSDVEEEDLDELLTGPLGNLARWTGGEIYTGLGAAEASRVARQVVMDLRQQYLIAFEPEPHPGWHPIELRTRDTSLVVRTRGGFMVRQPAGL
jgi:Ca-activated chloride channel family protein